MHVHTSALKVVTSVEFFRSQGLLKEQQHVMDGVVDAACESLLRPDVVVPRGRCTVCTYVVNAMFGSFSERTPRAVCLCCFLLQPRTPCREIPLGVGASRGIFSAKLPCHGNSPRFTLAKVFIRRGRALRATNKTTHRQQQTVEYCRSPVSRRDRGRSQRVTAIETVNT